MTYKPNPDQELLEHAYKRLTSTEFLARRVMKTETLKGGLRNEKVLRCFAAVARMRMITDPKYKEWAVKYVRKS